MVEFLSVVAHMPPHSAGKHNGDGTPCSAFSLHPPLVARHGGISTYRPAAGLAEAADVAMMLGVPLLLTGEPGTGKTRAAAWLAGALGLNRPLRMDVKSSTTGTDLLYSFDEVARFRDSSQKLERPLIEYVRFGALGLGILRGGGADTVLTDMFGSVPSHDLLKRAFGEAAFGKSAQASLLLPRDDRFGEAEHCVVLIDELDKAPRDTPNDLLAEFDSLSFAIPELGLRLSAGVKRPIVVLTSNSERSLPEPFLRRCAYFDIPFPDPKEIALIVSTTLGGYQELDAQTESASEQPHTNVSLEQESGKRFGPDSVLLKEAVEVFFAVRRDPQVHKKPGTAELLAWFDILLNRARLSPDVSLTTVVRQQKGKIERTLCALLKSAEDVKIGQRILWQPADT